MALGDLFSGIQGLFSPSQTTNTAGTTTTNANTQALTNQSGETQSTPYLQWLASQAANGTLQTALSGNTAGNALIGQSAGITPAQIASYANPNTAAQLGTLFDPNGALARSQASGLSAVKGAASANPYASSTAGTVKDYEAQVAANNANTGSNIVQAGWAPAIQAALGSQGLTFGAGAGLNQQQASALGQVPGLIGSAGQSTANNLTNNTNQITNSTGATTGTTGTTQTPSLGGVLGSLGGLALSAFSDERVKENIKEVGKTHDGQPIYTYNKFGSPAKEMGLLAQDVEKRHPHAVGEVAGIKTVNYDAATKGAERKADGGGVDGFHGKVREAFHTFHKLRKEAEHGHKREGFADGGFDASVGAGDPGGWGASVTPFNGGPAPDDDHWDGVRAAAIANGNPDVSPQAGPSWQQRLGAGLTSLGTAGQFKASGSADKGSDDPYGFKAIQAQMAAARGYDDGGTVRPHGYADGETVTPDGPSRGIGDYLSDAWSAIPKPFSSGMWTRDEYGVRNAPSALQDAGRLLAGFGANAGFNGGKTALSGPAEALNEIANERYKDAEQRRADAAITGTYHGAPTMAAGIATGTLPNGQKTLAATAQPSEIASREAETAYRKAATTAAGLEPQKQIEIFKQKTQREFAAQQLLASEVQKINRDLAWKIITPEAAATRRRQAQDLYTQSVGNIQDIPKSAAPALPPVLPNNTNLKMNPDGSLAVE